MSARQFLDTNVVVYAYDTSDAGKQAKAQSLLASAVREGDGAVSVQVLGEFFHAVVIKRKLMTAAEAAVAISALEAGLEVAQITTQIVKEAIAIHQRYQLRYWDSLIVATAKRAGCVEVISEDMNEGQDYGGIVLVNPFNQ